MSSILPSSSSPSSRSTASHPAIHLRPHPLRPASFHLGRFRIELPTSVRALSPRVLWLPLAVFLLLLYAFAGSEERAAVRLRVAEEGVRVDGVLAELRAGNFTLDAVPRTHSDSLAPRLAQLDELFRKAYAGHPALRGKTYDPPVFPPALSLEQFARFAHLLPTTTTGSGDDERYLFTTVLVNVAPITPDLFATLVALADFLGPHRFGLSVVEGPSSDGTAHLFLAVLAPVLQAMGVPSTALYLSLDRPSADFTHHNRIDTLAKLREEAVAPLRRHRDARWGTVVFFNDVWWSLSMGLEMLSQHASQGADMSCAWDLLWGNDYFYDIWVARDIHTGDLFHPMTTTWAPSTDLFPTSPKTKARNARHLPFQAFACWNGIAVIDASLLLSPSPVHFRRSDAAAGECAQAEVSLLCKDIWRKTRADQGRAARIMVVPGVRVAYERHVAETVRALDGAGVGGLIEGDEGWRHREKISWVNRPPKQMRCHPWPEVTGTGAGSVNVWENVAWIDPLDG